MSLKSKSLIHSLGIGVGMIICVRPSCKEIQYMHRYYSIHGKQFQKKKLIRKHNLKSLAETPWLKLV